MDEILNTLTEDEELKAEAKRQLKNLLMIELVIDNNNYTHVPDGRDLLDDMKVGQKIDAL